MFAMALWFFGNLQPPKNGDFAYNEFGRLPITANGRIVPMDSLARSSLLQLREKQTLNLEPLKEWNQNPKIIPATEWFANVMMNPVVADNWPCFRVDNPDLVSLLKLPERQDPAKRVYSWNQIQPMLETFGKESDRVQQIKPPERTAYENAIAKMGERMQIYATLRNTVQPGGAQDWPEELAGYEQLIPAGVAAVRSRQANEPYDKTNFNAFVAYVQEFQFMSSLGAALVLPPKAAGGQWRRMGDALLDAPKADNVKLENSIQDYVKMSGALADNKPEEFNSAVRDLHLLVTQVQPKAIAKAKAEVFFNQMEPFYNAMVIYVLAGLLAIVSWFNLSETLRRSAMWLIGLALVIHSIGLVYRMVLEGRPPVTNLYSAAVFVGWGASALGLVLERFHRNGIGLVVSATIGFITLIVAHHLALEGDTMEMMRAVLDTNFWLATHVVVVTLGYASTFVAGFLGLIYILRGVFTKTLDPATERSLTRMIYGIVCFATLFSFVGTVLGGIWADQSWGRFWGWDPKENGALIIVLWNALILHLRWGGMVRDRGLAVCAVVGNIVTAWSFFGVNMLGIGLHSYGFTEAGFKWLVVFVVSQLGFIVLGLLPAKQWKSFSPRAA